MFTLGDIIKAVGSLASKAIWVLIAAALLVFLWGLARFIISLGSESKAEEGKNLMTWGLIALFVMLSVAGLIKLLQSNLLGGGANLNL